MLGRIVLLFGKDKHRPPQPLKGNKFLTTDDSFRRKTTLTQEVPRQCEWSNISTDLDEAACRTDDIFQYDVAFSHGPADQDAIREPAKNAQDCCRLCELRAGCTHWTFEASNARCIITNASQQPIDTKDLPGAISARVALNKYIERRNISSIPILLQTLELFVK